MREISANERRLRTWLRDHHSIIGRREAIDLGASDALVRHKVATGAWEEIYRGVYRDTAAARTPLQILRAACVATAPVGVASHRSAAWLWDMVDRAPERPELTVPLEHRHGHRTETIVVHRSGDLEVDPSTVRI
jgi:hypothetical protein